MSQDEWLTGSKAAALIRNRLGCSPGRSEAILQEVRASGEVRARRGFFPVLLTTEDGNIDFSMRRGALNKGGVRCSATTPDAELSEEDLLDWLDRNHSEIKRKQHAGPGAPARYDWDDVEQFVRQEFNKR
jgi:hypothetical protein